jgi:hypothetical protein
MTKRERRRLSAKDEAALKRRAQMTLHDRLVHGSTAYAEAEAETVRRDLRRAVRQRRSAVKAP